MTELLPMNRRTLLKRGGALAGAGVAASLFPSPAVFGATSLKIGYVSPQTGPLAPFAEADNFVIGQVREALKGGLKLGARTVPVEILVKDSQSNPSRAAEVANELILSNEVDLMLVASTPETTNPVADQCEVNETPCVSTVAPWQPWFFTRGGKPDKGFDWTYHFFWGLEDVIGVFEAMWSQLDTNKVIGGLFPNDGDGNAWGDAKLGFPPVVGAKGYSLIDPGRYQNLADDFSAQIKRFKDAKADIITGVVLPPDWTTFWTQARQQGFRPKAASIGKALLFPVSVETLGEAGHNLSSEIWWSPSHPFKSSLDGNSAAALAAAYTAKTGKQWTQPIGFAHALFEVAIDAIKRTDAVGNRKKTRDMLSKMRLDTIVGPLDWTKGPVRNVAKTPLVGGQWRLGGKHKYDLVITSNDLAPTIPKGGNMEPLA